MLSPAEIIQGVSPLTAIKARALDWIIRQSDFWKRNRGQYSGVTEKVNALKTAPVSASGNETEDEAAIRAKSCDTLITLFSVEVGRGTLAKFGGEDGKDYSTIRDRDDLVAYTLSVLFEETDVDVSSSNYALVGDIGRSCPHSDTCCLSCLGYVK